MANTAARVGSINVLLQTQVGGAVNGLNTFASTVERTGTRSARAVAGIDRSVSSLNRTMSSISPRGLQSLTVNALRAQNGLDQLRGLALAASAALTGILPAGIAAGFVQIADRAHRMENALRTVTESTGELKSLQEELFQVSQRSRSGFESTVTLYARTARATEHLGLSQEKLLKITETVQKAFAIGGASPQEAQGAAIQLSQGIASDRLGGEEFRSVAENAPVLLRAMAKSLGVGIGQLREMAHAGELTADIVTKAILDANGEIEASFAKTSSTIMQAVQMVDNELLKFVSNSSEAGAAASAIVGILNVLGSNVEGIATILALLAVRWAAAFGARQITALTSSAAAMRATRLETVQAARDALVHNQAQHKLAQSTLAGARAAYEMSKANTVSASTRARYGKELQVALRNELATRTALQSSTSAYAAAARAASGYGVALSGLRAVGSSLLSFLGGPWGIALLAASGVMYLVAQRSQETAAATDYYSEAVRKAGEASTGSSPSIRAIAQDLFSVGAGATSAARAVSLMDAKAREVAALRGIFDGLQSVGLRVGYAFSEVYRELVVLYREFKAGSISAEEFVSKTDEIGRRAPSALAPFIASMQNSAKTADAARGEIAAVEDQIRRLDGSEANITINLGTRTFTLDGNNAKTGRLGKPTLDDAQDAYNAALEIAKRIGIDGITKDGTEKIKSKRGGGGGRSRASADDRFDQSVQSVYDRIEALRLEREALNLTYFEQVKREEALKLEQEALKQAREEARRKGEADWQSVQISAAKRAEIDRVAEAYAREAAATKKAKEEQEAFKSAASDMGGILRGIADGSMKLEDALIEMGKVLIKLLNDLNLASGGRGIFGGGWLQSLIGGFFGLSFHGGGTVGQQKMGAIPAAPYVGTAHEGRTIGGRKATHKEVLALLEKDETVFTAKDTGRIVDRLGAAANGIGQGRVMVSLGFVSDGALNIMPEVRSVAMGEAASASSRVAKAVPAMVDQRTDDRQFRRLRPTFAGL
jgi:tape measure domain-containing protein